MKVLVLNCGSSSVKYQLIETDNETVLARGIVDRIALRDSVVKYSSLKGEYIATEQIGTHEEAIQRVLQLLIDFSIGVVKNLNEIDAIGHRIAHGGEYFTRSTIIDERAKNLLKECIDLAPIHNPANIAGIEACEKNIPGKVNVGVFDTAFHQTLPEHAYLYPLPYEFYEKHKIRKYGFHGTSHKYVALRAAQYLKKPIEELKIITCHLGNGSSICAIKEGKSVDTSMGFTPLEGLMMGTRSGSIDPAIVLHLIQKLSFTPEEVNETLNKKSGLLGVSGITNDLRDILKAAREGNKRAQIALEMFCYRVRQYIGASMLTLGGVDTIVFTAGIGENSPEVREKVIEGLEWLGIEYDREKNYSKRKGAGVIEITKLSSKVKVLVIPTNEELMIAKETAQIIREMKNNTMRS